MVYYTLLIIRNPPSSIPYSCRVVRFRAGVETMRNWLTQIVFIKNSWLLVNCFYKKPIFYANNFIKTVHVRAPKGRSASEETEL